MPEATTKATMDLMALEAVVAEMMLWADVEPEGNRRRMPITAMILSRMLATTR